MDIRKWDMPQALSIQNPTSMFLGVLLHIISSTNSNPRVSNSHYISHHTKIQCNEFFFFFPFWLEVLRKCWAPEWHSQVMLVSAFLTNLLSSEQLFSNCCWVCGSSSSSSWSTVYFPLKKLGWFVEDRSLAHILSVITTLFCLSIIRCTHHLTSYPFVSNKLKGVIWCWYMLYTNHGQL